MLKLQFKEIAIGSTPEAIFFAFRKGIPILLSIKDYRPKPFNFFDPAEDLTDYFLENKEIELLTINGPKIVGLPVKYVYNKLLMVMAIRGHVLNGDHHASARLSENEVSLTFPAGLKSIIEFEKCYLFDIGSIISDIPKSSLKLPDTLEVHDYFLFKPRRYIRIDYHKFRGLKYQEDFWTMYDDLVGESYIVIRSNYSEEQMHEGRVTYPKIIELATEDKILATGVTTQELGLKHEYRVIYKESQLIFESDSIEDYQDRDLECVTRIPVNKLNKHYSDKFAGPFE